MENGDGENPIPKWRVDLRNSRNPYAALYYDPNDHEPLRTPRETYRLSENPHAQDYYLETEPNETHPESALATPEPTAVRPTTSKSAFEAGCRTIFRRYMPQIERSKLRPHHQDFIRRNSAASPERRHALLQELLRYDLSSEAGLRTYFNREEDAFTEAKLRNIEEVVQQQ